MMQALLILFVILAVNTVCGMIAVLATGSKFTGSTAALAPWWGWLGCEAQRTGLGLIAKS